MFSQYSIFFFRSFSSINLRLCLCVYACACVYIYLYVSGENGMATHSSILAWEIPWTEETGGLQSMGS